MTARELISELSGLIDQHGNIEVLVGSDSLYEIENVELFLDRHYERPAIVIRAAWDD